MSKKIKEITFKEFSRYCNDRACDGKWDFATALVCCKVAREVYEEKPLFRKNKAREQKWQELKKEYFNLEAELEGVN
jgi:hypothetical protein